MKASDILLTGATGFLGTSLRQELKLDGFNLVCPGADDGHSRIDFTLPFDLKLKSSIDIVVHAAGKAHAVPMTDIEKQEFYRVNLEGTKNLCRALEALNELPKSFIFISTVAVYGVDTGQGISEGHPLNGTTPYSDSKIEAEKWLRQWATENDLTLGILRLPLIAGFRPPGNLGAMIKGIKSGKYLSIGRANSRKSMVWAKDIAQIIPVLSKKGGTYNLTDGIHPTFGELEEAIALSLNKQKPIKVPFWFAKGLAIIGDLFGSEFPINSDKLRKITSTLTFDDSKARNELGWNPTSVLSRISELI